MRKPIRHGGDRKSKPVADAHNEGTHGRACPAAEEATRAEREAPHAQGEGAEAEKISRARIASGHSNAQF
jgi:hypothetical protein